MVHSSEKGFSLIEVLIAVLLIGGVFVACMLSYGTSMKTSYANKLRNNAIRLAQQTVENLKQYDQLGYDRNSDIWIPSNPNYVLNTEKPMIDNITYTVTKQIINTTDLNSDISGDNNYIPIRITVAWNYQGPYQIVTDTCLIKWP